MRGAGAAMRAISSGGGRVASRLAASSPRQGTATLPMAWSLAWSRPRMPALVGSGHGPRAVWGGSRAMSMDCHLNVPPPDVRELRDSFGSIIKVFTVTASPNWFMPWQTKQQRESTGSGFIIEGRRILTNAHCVADQCHVTVRKHGDPNKYTARVVAVGHECDLALLTTDDDSFWEGTTPLQLGGIPELQDPVAVIGYPTGGDNISVSVGVVSRVEPQQYTHGATNLLAIQIDAAINPGNSGGPAVLDHQVVGVAFQSLEGAENIGFIIPVPIIEHFLEDVRRNEGVYHGFPALGINCQALDNKQLRDYYGMTDKETGVLISKIRPLTHASEVLRKHDVILSIDGQVVGNDGTVPFRNQERISFDWVLSQKHSGESVALGVLREGERMNVAVIAQPLKQLVPIQMYDVLPKYFIYAGLVFIPLTQPYLHEYGEDWYSQSPRRLCDRALFWEAQEAGQELVILSQVLQDEANQGFETLCNLMIEQCNGVKVKNLKHLAELLEAGKSQAVQKILLEDERVIVLETAKAQLVHERILARHRIEEDMNL